MDAYFNHKFRDKSWKILKSQYKKSSGTVGECANPNNTNRIMKIPVNGSTKTNLATILHEAGHACLWDLDEIAIDETAESIAGLLWKLGWRKTITIKKKYRKKKE